MDRGPCPLIFYTHSTTTTLKPTEANPTYTPSSVEACCCRCCVESRSSAIWFGWALPSLETSWASQLMTLLSTRYPALLSVLLALSSFAVATAGGGQSWDSEVCWGSEPFCSLFPASLLSPSSCLPLLLYVPLRAWVQRRGWAEVSRGLWTPRAVYIGDKLEPSKEGSQQDSPDLANHFPPMKTGLVEYANKRLKIMCLCPVWGGKAKVMESDLSSFHSFAIKKQAQAECQAPDQKQRSTSEMQDSQIQAHKHNIPTEKMFWASSHRPELEVEDLPPQCLPKGTTNLFFPWMQLLSYWGSCFPKMWKCAAWDTLREMGNIWSSLCSLQPRLNKSE